MKRILLSTLLLILAVNTFSQNVYIPDVEFKTRLLSNSTINTNSDGEIQVSEAAAFTGEIIEHNYFTGRGPISDFTGIEAFINVTKIDFRNHSVNSIDLTQNTQLEEFQAYNNNFSVIDLSQNTKLKIMSLNNNNLAAVDLSNNILLEELFLNNNIIDSVNVSMLTQLKKLQVINNNLTSLDVSDLVLLEDFAMSDNSISSIDVTNAPNLKYLSCNNTTLSSLDITQNTQLLQLSARNTKFTTLDCSSNAVLYYLLLSNSDIVTINLNGLNRLKDIFLNATDLISLDVSNNDSIERLYVNSSTIQQLDLQNGANTLMTALSTSNTNNLTCILVDDTVYSNTNWTTKDVQNYYALVCNSVSINETNLNSLKIFPNPSNLNYISIVNGYDVSDIHVYELSGKEVFSSNKLINNKIDISVLNKGTYIIQFLDKNVSYTKQFIKL